MADTAALANAEDDDMLIGALLCEGEY